jgi:signal transduction histidine kinase
LVTTLALTSLVGWRLTRAALEPVEALRARAETISGSHGDARLPLPPGDDELSRLATTLNSMLDRLAATLERERAFSASASHELRTPLTLLRTQVDLALRRERPAAELVAALVAIGDDLGRLERLVERLLQLAREDAATTLGRVELVGFLRTVLARGTVQDERGGAGAHDCPAGAAVHADAELLETAVANLVRNAMEHGAEPIRVRVVEEADVVRIHVMDAGTGLPERFHERAFDRFTRAHASEHSAGGVGLGLAIAADAIHAQGGEIGIGDAPTGGADVWLELPRDWQAPHGG